MIHINPPIFGRGVLSGGNVIEVGCDVAAQDGPQDLSANATSFPDYDVLIDHGMVDQNVSGATPMKLTVSETSNCIKFNGYCLGALHGHTNGLGSVSMAANQCITQTANVPGAVTGQPVEFAPTDFEPMPADTNVSFWVSSANTVAVQLCSSVAQYVQGSN